MSRRRRKLVVTGGVALALIAGWLFYNPPGAFGVCTFGLTTYGAIPRLVSDLQIRCDGEVRPISKTHDLELKHVEWLLDPQPEVLIIATGWHGATQVAPSVMDLTECEVITLPSNEAGVLYNKLKQEGRKVAIHYHSTC